MIYFQGMNQFTTYAHYQKYLIIYFRETSVSELAVSFVTIILAYGQFAYYTFPVEIVLSEVRKNLSNKLSNSRLFSFQIYPDLSTSQNGTKVM